jgi:colanic acid biosynthesis glycosyl transferase WcaI
MRIIVYGINYAPEMTGIGRYTTEMCEWLVLQGHQVDVITALPYYPEWRIHPTHQGKGWQKEMINGVRIFRCPLYVPSRVTGLARMLHDFSFFLSSGFQWTKAFFRKYDLVFCIYPPLPVGIFPLLYRLFHNVKIWLHIQDLQVDAARQFGIIRNKVLLQSLESFERFMLRRMQVISTISESMLKRIGSKGIEPSSIYLFPNWVDLEKFYPMEGRRAEFKRQFGFDSEDKVVLYSGNIGEKQGLELALDVALDFQQPFPDVKFVISGDGALRKKLIAQAENKNLKNVCFISFVQSEQLPYLLNMADVHLVLQKTGASSLVMPSKLLNILACGGITVMSADPSSELYHDLSSLRIAAVCLPEDAPDLKRTLKNAIYSPQLISKKRMQEYVSRNYDKTTILRSFERIILHRLQ